MHSRIFQLSTKPIEKEDYITEEDFIDSFVGKIADYVSSNTDREDDIEWFKSCYSKAKVSVEDSVVIFPKGFREGYFENKFEVFKKLSSELTFEEFAGLKYSGSIFDIKEALEDEYGFYIYIEDEGVNTLDYFIRRLMKENTIYYFGATVDYHY